MYNAIAFMTFFKNIAANRRAIFLKLRYKYTPSIVSCHITTMIAHQAQNRHIESINHYREIEEKKALEKFLSIGIRTRDLALQVSP